MNGAAVKSWIERLKSYRMALLVLFAGIVLLLLPTAEEDIGNNNTVSEVWGEAFCLEEFEQQLSEVLSDVDGAGEVRVVLTLKSGMRRVLAQDIRQDGDGYTSTTVLAGKQSSQQEGVVVQTTGPVFQGALVVCPGGGDAQVRLALMDAVCALTGLGSDRVSICKGR